MKLIRNFAIVLFLAVGSFHSMAAKPILESTTSDELLLTEVQKNCEFEICKPPFSNQILQSSKTARKLFYQLQKIAEEQVNVWGDTILEGDYIADGEVRLTKISAVYQDSELVAYRITYNQNAWDTSTCNYDGNHHQETIVGCAQGIITESTYVSSSLNYYEVDENQFAEFEN
jgi:hypothetical protein